jgi:hypothetical protein
VHRAVLLRRIIAVQGTAHVEVVLEPAAEFGRAHLRELHRDDDGRWEGRVGELHMRWSGGAAADVHGEIRTGLRLTVPEGAHHDLVLELSDQALGAEPLDPDRTWQGTVHSRLTCAAGLRAIATTGASTADATAWSGLADTILADATTDCLHPSGRWQRAPDDPRIDAALLLPAIRGALPAADPRSVATVQAVRDELGQQGYVHRFRQDTRPPGQAEGAFTLCGFLMALAHHQQGDPLAARTWFERNRAACGPPGLFSEEYDVTQRHCAATCPKPSCAP